MKRTLKVTLYDDRGRVIKTYPLEVEVSQSGREIKWGDMELTPETDCFSFDWNGEELMMFRSGEDFIAADGRERPTS